MDNYDWFVSVCMPREGSLVLNLTQTDRHLLSLSSQASESGGVCTTVQMGNTSVTNVLVTVLWGIVRWHNGNWREAFRHELAVKKWGLGHRRGHSLTHPANLRRS